MAMRAKNVPKGIALEELEDQMKQFKNKTLKIMMRGVREAVAKAFLAHD